MLTYREFFNVLNFGVLPGFSNGFLCKKLQNVCILTNAKNKRKMNAEKRKRIFQHFVVVGLR